MAKLKHSDDIPDMSFNKVLPHAVELEQTILGAITLEPNAFEIVSDILHQDCFYKTEHQKVFKAMVGLSRRSMIIDLTSVVEELKAMGELDSVGGPYFITKLQDRVTSTASLEQNARILLQYHIKREIIRISGNFYERGYDDTTDVFDLLNSLEKDVFGIANSVMKKNFEDAPSIIAKTLSIIDQQRNSQDLFTGVPTGFESLDKITYGWQPTDFIIIAARPSIGKSALALNLAKNAALHKIKPTPVGFFSLEMSASQCMNRMLSAESGILFERVQRGTLSDFEYKGFMEKGVAIMEKAPIYIDDTAGLNIYDFRSKSRKMVNKHNVGLIIIDYLQLMSGDKDRSGNREQEISNISRNIKIIAKELNVPIIALSQLSRQVENRKESKMPMLSDLRESGSLEQDSDCVMFIYRPEYYDIDTNENGDSTAGETHIKTAKNRNGKLGVTRLRARLEIQKFEEVPDTGLPSNFKPISQGNMPKTFSSTDNDTNPF